MRICNSAQTPTPPSPKRVIAPLKDPDKSVNGAAASPDPVIKQAKRDLDAGMFANAQTESLAACDTFALTSNLGPPINKGDNKMSNCRHIVVTSLVLLTLAFGGCDMGSKESMTKGSAPRATSPKTLTAQLNGGSEVPPVVTEASGTAEATLTNGNVLTWKLSYAGLSGPVMGAHFHGPAISGQNAAVASPMTGSLSSPISGTVTLTAGQTTDLLAGKWYVNLHTAANPNGEIRGQLNLRQ
jgi:hypothetical protein